MHGNETSITQKLKNDNFGIRVGVSLRTIEKIEQRQESKVAQKNKMRIEEYLIK